MPGYNYESTAKQLEKAGVPSTMPCAILSQATLPNEQVHITTVEELHRSPRLPSPTLLVVGEVVRLAKPAQLHQQLAWPKAASPNAAEFRLQFAANGAGLVQERAE
jgi:siroheme synthase